MLKYPKVALIKAYEFYVLHIIFIVKRYFFFVFRKIFLAYQKKVVSLPSENIENAMVKNNRIARIRTLYALFLGIIALCVGLFFFNIFTVADPLDWAILDNHNKDYSIFITDLPSTPTLHGTSNEVDGLPEGLSANAYVNRFDVVISADSEQQLQSGKSVWCTWLQVFCVLSAIAMTVLIVMALISFYINVRRGKIFPKKNIKWLTWAGILMIAMSLGMDISTAIERSLAADLLEGSTWQSLAGVSIHTTRIIFGLTIIFLAEIFAIGREMQEEQELTI